MGRWVIWGVGGFCFLSCCGSCGVLALHLVFGCSRVGAEVTAAKLDGRALELGLAAFHERFGRYPAAGEEVAALYESGVMRGSETPDPRGARYELRPPAGDGAPVPFRRGPDGIAGTEDDIAATEPRPPSCILSLCF